MTRPRPTACFAMACLLLSLVLTAPTAAQTPGEQLQDKVAKAYRQLQTYHGSTRFAAHWQQGRWRFLQETDNAIAFDREKGRLKIDSADFMLVVDQGRLKLSSDQLANRILDAIAPQPLTYVKLAEAAPILNNLIVPELILLLDEKPWQTITGGNHPVTTLDPDPQDEAGFPRLQLSDRRGGDMVLRINPTTWLIDSVSVNRMGGEEILLTNAYTEVDTATPLNDATFAFDDQGKTTFATFMELVRGGQQGASHGHPLEGQQAPALNLPTLAGEPYSLRDDPAKVIVLDFWATWCPPCVEGLPKLQAIHDWARQENLSVAIYAVNLQETGDQVKAFWQRHKLSMPVLMDEQGVTGQPYRIEGIPQTVIIRDNVVRHVHVGLAPDMEQTLRAQITALLAEGQDEAPATADE